MFLEYCEDIERVFEKREKMPESIEEVLKGESK